jgi:lipoprotein NlpI
LSICVTKYAEALHAYSKVVEKSVDADYAYFQRAISVWFYGSKMKKKINEINAF